MVATQDIGALRHEVHAAEHDVLGLWLVAGPLRQLEGIPADIGKLDDLVPLIVMPQDDKAVAQTGTDLADPGVGFAVGKACQMVWKQCLQHRELLMIAHLSLRRGGDVSAIILFNLRTNFRETPMTRKLLLFLALVAFAAPQLLAQTAAVGTVQGTVVRVGTNQPIAGVQVTLTGKGGMSLQDAQFLIDIVAGEEANRAPEVQQLVQMARETVRNAQNEMKAVTDALGQFTLRNVPAGPQNLQAELKGYFGTPEDGDYPETATQQFTVTAAQASRVTVSMVPSGTISGRVVDQNRQPLSNRPVQYFIADYSTGSRRLLPLVGRLFTTDDRGEYRLYELPPGEYYVAAEPTPQPGGRVIVMGTPIPIGPGGEISVTTFYPGVMDPASAVAVDLRPGVELTGINIQMMTAVPAKISGRLTLAVPASTDTRTAAVAVMPRATKGLTNAATRMPITPRDDGTFEIPNLPPDIYDLIASYPMAAQTGWGPETPLSLATPTRVTASPAAGSAWAFGRTTVDVRNSNMNNVAIVVSKGVDLKGRLLIDGKPSAANIRISVQPESFGFSDYDHVMSGTLRAIGGFEAPIAADGSFTIPRLPEGRYRFWVGLRGMTPGRGAQAPLPTLPETSYIADIRQGNVSVYDNGLVVGREPLNPVEVLINTSSGNLEGTVLNAELKPAAAITVVLIPPENRRQNPALYPWARSDAQGRFTMMNLAPGRYTVFAWENTRSGAYRNAEFLAKYFGRGTAVNIEAGARATASVNVIRDEASTR
jgi:hypothetical protein